MAKNKRQKIALFAPSPKWRPLSGRGRIVYQWLLPNKGIILDIGGGEGYIARHFKNKFKMVYELELSFRHVKLGKKWYPYIKFVNGDAENISFRDGYFDAVTLIEVLEHVKNDKAVISEIYRILKPNGIFILTTPHKGLFHFLDPANTKRYFSCFYSLYKWLFTRIQPKAEELAQEHRHYTIDNILSLLSKDFMVKKIEIRGFFLSQCLYLAMVKFFRHRSLLTHFLQKIIDADLMVKYGSLGSQLFVYAIKK